VIPLAATSAGAFPPPVDQYSVGAGATLLQVLAARIQEFPFNAVATGIFLLAVLHTFTANHFLALSHRVQRRHDARAREAGREASPSVLAEILHFFGEVEVVFGLWAVVLFAAIVLAFDWTTAETYIETTVDYREALFVVVVMAIASTRPVVSFAGELLGRLAGLGGGTVGAWWVAILGAGPMLGSFITEPAAMTICALLLGQHVYAHGPSVRLRYATLGLLFVNVSIGGTLTHFAAPPVLIVARHWDWTLGYMSRHFGWKALVAAVVSTLLYFLLFRRELAMLSGAGGATGGSRSDSRRGAIPFWVTAIHLGFLAFTVAQSHYPVLVIGGLLFFLGFTTATAAYQAPLDLRAPLLVGFFLGGLVTHGSLQAWWITPVLGRLSETPLFLGAGLLTAFNDNALITYLATLVPDLGTSLRYAVVAGAVAGGGMTVIANAPNPAGQALLARYFEDGVSPFGLAAGAAIPTVMAALAFLAF
jgi:Putative Na+/H+ antiporter